MTDPITLPTSAVAADLPSPGPTGLPPDNHQPATLNPPAFFPQAKDESDRAFEAFRAYLELGPSRRLAAAGRKVGASQRTVKRWANDFDWRGRIKTRAAHATEQYSQTENAVHREELLDAAARAKAFRDRQYAVAEAIFAAAECYLERLDGDDLDLMSFADACKALVVASRLGQQAADRATDEPAAPDCRLRDQLTSLLDQACGETPARNVTGNPPSAATLQETPA